MIIHISEKVIRQKAGYEKMKPDCACNLYVPVVS